ncbi:hypothetical protein BGZ65_009636, partial [Modicella reniformis]
TAMDSDIAVDSTVPTVLSSTDPKDMPHTESITTPSEQQEHTATTTTTEETDRPQSPAQFDPLATTTSIPSSDEGLDDDEEDVSNKTDNGESSSLPSATSLATSPLEDSIKTTEDTITEDAIKTTEDTITEDTITEDAIKTTEDTISEDTISEDAIKTTEDTITEDTISEDTITEDAIKTTEDTITEDTIKTTKDTAASVAIIDTPSPNHATVDDSVAQTAESVADNEVASITTAAIAPLGFAEDEQPEKDVAPKTKTEQDITRTSSSSSPSPSPSLSLSLSPPSSTSTSVATSPTSSPTDMSRPLSREELRRRGSFLDSKDVANMRYSSPTISESMRPIADPRFKSRFQNILAEWKARANN